MKKILSRSLTSTLAAVVCATAAIVTVPIVSAAAPAAVSQAPVRLAAKVQVPSNGEAVTYMLNGKKVTIAPGETADLPSGATHIVLPVGTHFILTSWPTGGWLSSKGGMAKGGMPKGGMAKGGMPSTNTYDLSKPVVLAALTSEQIAANTGAFGLVGQSGLIKLPNGTITNLIDAANGVSSTTVNPFNLLQGSDITDGNAPYGQ